MRWYASDHATDIPSYEVMGQCRQSHASYTTTDSILASCQKLVFPCVWVSAKHGTDVPAPPQSSTLLAGSDSKIMPQGKIVVWQSPNMPGQEDFPVSGLMGRYDFSHGHLLEHPLRTG